MNLTLIVRRGPVFFKPAESRPDRNEPARRLKQIAVQ